MKKILIRIIVGIGVLGIIMVFWLNRTSNSEKIALNFIKEYYAKYEKSDEIKALTFNGDIQFELIDLYFKDNFSELATEECINALKANRYVADFRILESDIKKVEVVKFSVNHVIKKDEVIQYDFVLDLKYTKGSDEILNKNVHGWIVVKRVDGQWKVDGFRTLN